MVKDKSVVTSIIVAGKRAGKNINNFVAPVVKIRDKFCPIYIIIIIKFNNFCKHIFP